MADLAKLGIEVDASGAIRTTQQLNRELEKTAQVGTTAATVSKRQDEQLRKLVESGTI